MRLTRRSAAAWAAVTCAAGMVAAGGVTLPAATAMSGPGPFVVEPVPTGVLASAKALADAGLGTAVDAHLAGENLFVEVSTASGRRVYWRPVDGTNATWSNTWGGRTLTGDLLASEHDVLLLDVGSTDVLAWSRDGGGSRTVPEGTVLGRGAQRVAYGSGAAAVTQGVTGGERVAVQPANQSVWYFPSIADGFAITGDALYAVDEILTKTVERWHGPTGEVTRGTGGDPCGSVPGASGLHVEDARGRFALATCTGGVVGLTADSAGVYDDVTLAVGMKRTSTPPQLGDGFVLGVSTTTGDLLAAPSLGGSPGKLGKATAFDLDDTGTRVVLVDGAGDVRIARDLRAWSSDPATEIVDHAAPVSTGVTPISRPPAVPDTAAFQAAVGGSDRATPPFRPSGKALHEARYRIRLAGETQFSAWKPVPPGSTPNYPAPSRICWTGRITDNAGNVSPWNTNQTCEDTVGTTNQVASVPLPPAVKADADGKTTVRYQYGGVNGEYLAGSEVRYRWFVPGQTPPSWTVQDSGSGTEVGFRLQNVPTGYQVCFQARGYDADASVSKWMARQCTFVDPNLP
ncbi:hypothetical protein [Promicromonospora sp. NPDC023805]|uniref:hypothetical protein n=1 Tax=Promicromonospora sp. NPDC023805 TaxID=3154696 RepID=UPI0033C71C93